MFVRAGGCGGGEGKDVLCTFVALDVSAPLCLCKCVSRPFKHVTLARIYVFMTSYPYLVIMKFATLEYEYECLVICILEHVTLVTIISLLQPRTIPYMEHSGIPRRMHLSGPPKKGLTTASMLS